MYINVNNAGDVERKDVVGKRVHLRTHKPQRGFQLFLPNLDTNGQFARLLCSKRGWLHSAPRAVAGAEMGREESLSSLTRW